jgi:hypothetical protein
LKYKSISLDTISDANVAQRTRKALSQFEQSGERWTEDPVVRPIQEHRRLVGSSNLTD